ncbi:HGxxPAAW family protein [Streptomyces sp. NPDC001185]|uniref:HGxxPAAW family protein n=1 Tax=Streptomyces sp. NPDC001185 TaxID=3154380 RepID=UPI00331D9FDB
MGMHGDHDLGHTVAGWAGTTIAVAGCTAAAVALAAGSAAGLWLGGAVVVLAAPATWLLHLAGWGKATGPRPVAQQHWRVRDRSARHGHPGCLGCRLAGRGASAPRVTPTVDPPVAPAVVSVTGGPGRP